LEAITVMAGEGLPVQPAVLNSEIPPVGVRCRPPTVEPVSQQLSQQRVRRLVG
jgi:hypothetical protein